MKYINIFLTIFLIFTELKMARFILLVLASTILACEAKFKTGFAPCG
jgi:hypothetical protein